MGQNIQEWTKWNLWKTALKYFTWSILEYFVLWQFGYHGVVQIIQ